MDAERWNDLFRRVQDWRQEIEQSYAVPADRELHACDLLARRGKLASSGGADHRLSPQQGAEVFTGGLRVIEEAWGCEPESCRPAALRVEAGVDRNGCKA